MKAGTLRCDGCSGSVPIPVELVLSTPCPYCGRAVVLPDQRERRVAIEQMREAEARRQHEARQGLERETTRRLAMRWKVVGGILGSLLIAVPIIILVRHVTTTIEDQETARRARQAEQAARERAEVERRARAGADRLSGMIAKAQGGACGAVFVKPSTGRGKLDARFTLAASSCARILATTGVESAKLAVAIVGGDGTPVPGPAPARDVDHLYCPRVLGGTQSVDVSAGDAELSLAVMACNREIPTDPDGLGMTRVSAIMKERRAAGCREILLPAKTFYKAQTMTATLVPNGCIQLIYATGMLDNDVAVELTTPVGDKAPAPPPGREGILTYCTVDGGAHTGSISSAIAAPFTAAALACSRRAVGR